MVNMFKFKDQIFNTKLERDAFMLGYEFRLKEEQKDAASRGKDNEKSIPFRG